MDVVSSYIVLFGDDCVDFSSETLELAVEISDVGTTADGWCDDGEFPISFNWVEVPAI